MFLPTFAKPVLYEVPTYLAEFLNGTINIKTKRKKAMEKNVKVIDTYGLDETTISQIEEVMIYTNDYYENDTLFVELHNSKGEIIRIFPERIQEIC